MFICCKYAAKVLLFSEICKFLSEKICIYAKNVVLLQAK